MQLIENATAADYERISFPELLEIKGYLLCYRVYALVSLGQLFPNLTVIRGSTLFMDYSLVIYDMINLKEIGLHSLEHIERGSTRIDKCPQLCYVNTVDWSSIGGPNHSLHYFNTNEERCDSCPERCNGLCWSQDHCQVTSKANCHPECIGCKGPTDKDCILCKSLIDGDKCVPKCKKPKIIYPEYGKCITKSECQKLPHGPWWSFKEECVKSCPTGYNKLTNREGCELCLNCSKYCDGIEINSIASAETLTGCTHVNGPLSIRVNSMNMANELEKSLGSIKEITHYLKIYRSYALTSFESLRNLKVIHGQQLYNNRHAVVVYENQDLHKLWPTTSSPIKIKNGTLLFHYNSHLCPAEIEKFARGSNLKYSTFDVSPYSNGDKRACNNITLNVTVSELTSSSVVLEWDEYATNGNTSLIIGYLVYYIEDNTQNITIFDEQEECDRNNWYSKFVSNASVSIDNLNAFSHYAYYIKTYATIPTSSGQTSIMYFKTLTADPSKPYNLKASSTSSDSITLTWNPPQFPNGILSHYLVIAYLESDDPRFISRRNYCDYPHKAPRPKLVTPTPTIETAVEPCCKKKNKSSEDTVTSICSVLNHHGCKNYMTYSIDNQLTRMSSDENLNIMLITKHNILKREDQPQSIIEETIEDPKATSYTITQLKFFSIYFILLKACNNKTLCSGGEMTSERTLKKDDADDIPSGVLVQVSGRNVVVEWLEPKDPNSVIVAYYVEHRRLDLENAAPITECITEEEYASFHYQYQIKDLFPGKYAVRVRAVSLAGEGRFCQAQEFYVSFGSGVALTASLLTVAFIVIILGVLGFCYYYYRKNNSVDRLRLLRNAHSAYAGSNFILDEWELKREDVEIQNELGQGTFGMVYNGIIRSKELPCAVKTVNSDADEQDRTYFLHEASVMKSFSKAYHVVKLLGVVSRGSPPLVVMELMERGDLKTFLRLSRNGSSNITCAEMYRMAAEIADGMMYLSANKFVHRDLAARNCMVAADHTVKIGDFGMARDVYYTDYYKKHTGGLMPIRWMSPESLADGVFTSESDVWSYGVVLWEIATLAEQPYQGLANEQVFQFITSQGTLQRPVECPDLLYDIMEVCWKWKPKDRPLFHDIIRKLESHIGQHFRLVSFFHSFEGDQYMMNLQERTYSHPALINHLNKSDGVYWDSCYDDVDLNTR
ncbi:hypothetical protein PPYR_15663 [Photinus pyralis]|uniref:receptor protein-tyrosine kinase n=3 Tax=Photinus pyralis TaxID=7054 RepID=A0A5N3ZY93_PHOPY|nr:hypothetical protein PPYR_15663 [Photinus pyralis]